MLNSNANSADPVTKDHTARVIEVTTSAGCTHLVAEEQFITGCRTGRFVALCAAPVLAASLTIEERERCWHCVHKVGGRERD